MIQTFVDKFMENKSKVLEQLASDPPSSYTEIVRLVVENMRDPDGYGDPDPGRVHVINDGDYQGTLVYVIGAEGYQPNDYWYVKVYYGSCSGCDTLEAIRSAGGYDDPPTKQQINDYWTLALHVVQGIKEM
jgi:hypothetical protein